MVASVSVPPVRLLLVDGFAGRGRYVRGEAGSPLLLVRVANEFVKWGLEQPRPVQVHVEIAFIESDPDNYAILTRELKKTEADSTRPCSRYDFISPFKPRFLRL